MKSHRQIWFNCDCSLLQHSFRASYFSDEYEDKCRNVYLDWMVDKNESIWFRIKNAFKYIFRNEQYSYGETILSTEHYEQLKEITEFLKPCEKSSLETYEEEQIGEI
jgi:hypothetical protein